MIINTLDRDTCQSFGTATRAMTLTRLSGDYFSLILNLTGYSIYTYSKTYPEFSPDFLLSHIYLTLSERRGKGNDKKDIY
jgi:hypothetical protein